MDQYFSDTYQVWFQSKFHPNSRWFDGTVEDFAYASEIEFTETDGMCGGIVYAHSSNNKSDRAILLPKCETFAWWDLGEPLPDEVLEAIGQPVLFYWRNDGFIFEVYRQSVPNEEDDE